MPNTSLPSSAGFLQVRGFHVYEPRHTKAYQDLHRLGRARNPSLGFTAPPALVGRLGDGPRYGAACVCSGFVLQRMQIDTKLTAAPVSRANIANPSVICHLFWFEAMHVSPQFPSKKSATSRDPCLIRQHFIRQCVRQILLHEIASGVLT